MDSIIVTREAISREEVCRLLTNDPACGAVVTFEGVVRNHNAGRTISTIEYECYEAMTRSELEKIVREVRESWKIHQVAIAHRIGRLVVGEVSLVVMTTAPHRREAFEAAEQIIDELKKRVPIWKKEYATDTSPSLP